MIEEELARLLERQWTDEERAMINRIMDGLLYYKKLIPKALKNDVVAALQLCNRLKLQLEDLIQSRSEEEPEGTLGQEPEGTPSQAQDN
ncbi:MAG: hypothetical protein EBU90_22310 [Proteobacteria bacterium]|nr:hypothetical protein [Pseudomonadota bacterium]